MIGALIWKEWQPLRWKLVFACVLVGAFEVIALKTRIVPDVGVYVMAILGTMLLMPVFTAMGLVAAEREEGSLAFGSVLPVKARTVYWIKMLVGSAVTAGPLLVGMLIALTTAGREEYPFNIVRGYLSGMAAAVLVFVWIMAFAMRCRGEAFVPLVYVGLVSVWSVLVFIDEMNFQKTILNRFSMLITPFGVMEIAVGDPLLNGGWVVIHATIAAGLLLWGMRRFEKLTGRLS